MKNEENLNVTEKENNMIDEEKTNISEVMTMDEENGLVEWTPMMVRSNSIHH